MKKNTFKIAGITILALVALTLVVYILSLKNSDITVLNKNEIVEYSGFKFEKTKNNEIKKTLVEGYLETFVTVAEGEKEYSINIEGIPNKNKVYLINQTTGELHPFENINDVFKINIELKKGINYGIIDDYALVGAIRIVDKLDEINENELFQDIISSISCGL